jgi:hypothetical protein
VQTLTTERSARTLALDPSSHKLYLVSARFAEKKPGEKRPAILPGGFNSSSTEQTDAQLAPCSS